MEKKRILFVNGHLRVGGIEKTLVDLLKYIDYSKYDIDLLLLEGSGDYISQVPDNVNVGFFDNTGAYGPFFKMFFKNILRMNIKLIIYRLIILFSSKFGKKHLNLLKMVLPIKKHYNIAIAYRTGLSADVVAYTVNSSKKLVWWHNGEFNLDNIQKKDTLETWSKFDNIVAVSEGCKKLLEKEFPALSNKMRVLYNILDIKKIEENAEINNINKCSSAINIISVGNLSIRKHFENAIIATKKLVDGGVTNFHWVIVGDGDEMTRLQKMIIDYNVSSQIELIGNKPNPYPYIKSADMMVHTSYGEAHCTAVLEAMALKIPCLVTETYIPQDFTINGVNCFMAEQNADSLYEGIVLMLNNREKLEQISSNAFDWVSKRYTPDKIIADFYKLLE